jgi:putative solute:sodium symporter small subunit
MQITRRHWRYWRINLRLTAVLLAVWAVVTFVPIYWAQELNRIEFMGWPLGFYIGAQGALVVYLALVWFYAFIMDRLDRELAVGEGSESS